MVAIKEFMTVHLIASEACSYRNRYKLSDGIPNPVIPESALLLREIQRKLSRAGLNPAPTFRNHMASWGRGLPEILGSNAL